jgi:hypothetical protein
LSGASPARSSGLGHVAGRRRREVQRRAGKRCSGVPARGAAARLCDAAASSSSAARPRLEGARRGREEHGAAPDPARERTTVVGRERARSRRKRGRRRLQRSSPSMRWASASAAVDSIAFLSVGGSVCVGSRWWAAVGAVGRMESEREEMRGIWGK